MKMRGTLSPGVPSQQSYGWPQDRCGGLSPLRFSLTELANGHSEDSESFWLNPWTRRNLRFGKRLSGCHGWWHVSVTQSTLSF